MNKILFCTLVLFLTKTNLFAQCTPLPYNGNHIIITPDSAHFPHATLNQAFSTTFYIQVAHDTLIKQLGLYIIDSIHVDSVVVIGKPSGTVINFQCNTQNCTFLGASTNCMKISASAQLTKQLGSYKTKVYTTAHGSIDTFKNIKIPYVIGGYNVVVDTTASSSIKNTSLFKDISFYPNPVLGTTLIITVPESRFFQLYNLTGQILLRGELNSGENNIKLPPNISNGIYFIQMGSDGYRSNTQKLIINR